MKRIPLYFYASLCIPLLALAFVIVQVVALGKCASLALFPHSRR